MNYRTLIRLIVIALALPAASAAQTATQVASAAVTLSMPVDLTQLGPDITKVRVGCSIRSAAITTGTNNTVIQFQEIPVTGGAVKTTAAVVFSLTNLNNPVGQTADVVCSLHGWSQSQQKWDQFTGGHQDPSFRTSTTVGMITTTFVW